jgi:ubiquinone/menaquinone biosynthesis C-methylase UbiE
MDLMLAVVLSSTETGCRVQSLEIEMITCACYSSPMIEHQITAIPGQLVVLDTGVKPPQIVYRYPDIQVVGAGSSCPEKRPPHSIQLIQDDQPVDPVRLCSETLPQIQAMYTRMEAAQNIDPKQVIEQGYDCIADRYLEWAKGDTKGVRERYVGVLLQELPSGAKVLELGCGAGVPVARALSKRFEVTGVDLSARQIALARQHVPRAHFIQADMTELDLPIESYDGIVACYALFHVPREQQPALLCNMAAWLCSGGLLVATMGAQSSKGDVEEDWLGAPMYWSSYDSETNVRLVQEAGLEIVQAREEMVEEHGEQVTFLWIVARKPGRDT